MKHVLRLPAYLSLLVLAAHFLRMGVLPWVLLLLLVFPLMALHRRWVMRVVQLVLLLGALEWTTTMLRLVGQRSSQGLPWHRMAVILGSVAAVSTIGALLFELPVLRSLYARGSSAAGADAAGVAPSNRAERL